MANLSKASNVVQEKYILYDVTGFTQKWHSIPVATNCKQAGAFSFVFLRIYEWREGCPGCRPCSSFSWPR